MLGLILRAQGRHEEASQSFARAAEIFKKAFNETHASVASARMELGIELTSLGRFPEAERELLAAYKILGKDPGGQDASSAKCAAAIAGMYEAWDRAEPGRGFGAKARE